MQRLACRPTGQAYKALQAYRAASLSAHQPCPSAGGRLCRSGQCCRRRGCSAGKPTSGCKGWMEGAGQVVCQAVSATLPCPVWTLDTRQRSQPSSTRATPSAPANGQPTLTGVPPTDSMPPLPPPPPLLHESQPCPVCVPGPPYRLEGPVAAPAAVVVQVVLDVDVHAGPVPCAQAAVFVRRLQSSCRQNKLAQGCMSVR